VVTFDELDHHAMEQLVFESDEISLLLRGHIFIEKILETLISDNLKNPEALFSKNRSFDLKVNLAKAMALIDEKYNSAFKALNNIRNNYAHGPSYKVTFKELSGLKFDWTAEQDQAYTAACTKGVEEAAKIAMIFLCWKAILLVRSP
jgi:hypothetical protein